MRTLGVDLAAQPKNTSIAVLDGTRVIDLVSSADNDQIVTLRKRCGGAPIGVLSPCEPVGVIV